MIYVLYHGNVDIAYWEYVLSFFYLVVLYLYFVRIKNIRIKTAPEYRYYVGGLFAKIFGGMIFSLIYFYYYKGGDTISYFYSALSMAKLAKMDPSAYLTVLFGEISMQNRALFNMETGYPFSYVYFDPRTFFVIRLISPLILLTFESYLITTVVLATLSYIGVWKVFRTFVSYFPSLTNKFAIAFLYMPSVIFWGSAILKDTLTFSATCWWIYFTDMVFLKRRSIVGNSIGLVLSAIIMVIMKPYIFMVLVPVTLLWLLHKRLAAIRNLLVKFILLPVATVLLLVSSYALMDYLGEYLDKFSLDKALTTIQVTQGDLKRSEQYGSNYFEVGEMDGSWASVISKFPIAVNAALFRPYVWESGNLVMMISGLENLYLLLLFLYVLIRARFFFIRVILGNPLVLFCMAFSFLFAFVIGITTPNFGALVRFKIPFIPLFISGLYIINMLENERRALGRHGFRIDLSKFWSGMPMPVRVKSSQGQPSRASR